MRIKALIAVMWVAAAAASPPPLEPYLTISGNWGPQWLPGAERLVYVNARTGVPQAWVAPVVGGVATQITNAAEGISGVYAHPLTGDVVVTADAGGNERDQLYLYKAGGAEPIPLGGDADAFYNVGDWNRDGRYLAVASNERDESFVDIYVVDLTTGDRRLVFRDDGYNQAVAFSPDGRWLLVYHAKGSEDCDLYLVDAAADAAPRLLLPHESEMTVGDVAWAADGEGFYFSSNLGRDYLSLAYYDVAAAKTEWLETPPWDVEDVVTSWGGRWLLWTTNEDGYDVAHLRDLTTGKEVSPPPGPRGVIDGFRFSPDETRLLFSLSTPAQPSDVYMWRIGEEAATRVTQADLAGVDAASFVDCSLAFFASEDGLVVPAYLYVPKNAPSDNSTPVIYVVHGGPKGQQRPYFDALFQYWLATGYAVFAPNIRGSSGYGETYADADNRERRVEAIVDVVMGYKYLRHLPWCDRYKVALYGSSYGGYMVLAQLTKNAYYWAAGVDICGISNFVTYLENTGPWRVSLREDEYGSLERNRAILEALSPVNDIHKIRAPLMVIHGANDPRVPVGEAEAVVAGARKTLGEEKVVYLRYEDEGHGLRKRENRLDAYPRMMDFLDAAFAERQKLKEEVESGDVEMMEDGELEPPKTIP